MSQIAVIAGDGAGPEVMKEALRVLDLLKGARSLPLQLHPFPFGADHYLATGEGLPPDFLARAKQDFKAILFGAVGDPRVKDGAHARQILLGLRFGLDLYVNFRPCKLIDERLCPLKGKGPAEVDFVVFRENTEGPYGGQGGSFKKGTPDEIAISEDINTRKGVERILTAAFHYAKTHGKTKVALADKSNAIPAQELWTRCFKELATQYPQMEARHYYADALAMQMVLTPERFQVIVTNNLFGDLLTDIGAALAGGLGLAASANLNPASTPLFEPVHGSAPDLAGQGKVNPFAMLLTTALMLEHLGHRSEAALLERAVEACVRARECTVDAGGTLTTIQATDAVLRRVETALRLPA